MEKNRNIKIVSFYFFVLLSLIYMSMYNCKSNLLISHLNSEEIKAKPKKYEHEFEIRWSIYYVKRKTPMTFSIEYDGEIKEDEIPDVYVNDKKLECWTENKIYSFYLKCNYTVDIIPLDPYDLTKTMTYSGYVQNKAGEKEVSIHFTSTLENTGIKKISIENVIYEKESKCQTAPSTSFKFYLKYSSEYNKELEPFEMQFTGEQSTYSVSCKSKNIEEKLLSCQLNAVIIHSGNYYPESTKEVISLENFYYVNAFEFKSKSIFLSLIEYNPLLFTDILNNVFASFKNKANYDIEFSFKNKFSEKKNYPTIKINISDTESITLNENCIDKNNKLICTIKNSEFSEVKTYKGEIINVCGLREAEISITISNTNVLEIESVNLQGDKCSELPPGTSFEIKSNSLSFIKEDTTIKDNIYLATSLENGKTAKINLECQLTTQSFTCTTKQSVSEFGYYHLVVDKSLNYGELSLFPFCSNEYTKSSSSYAEIDKEKTKKETTVNYGDKETKKIFEIYYKSQISVIPKVREVNSQKEVTCYFPSSDKSTIACEILEKIFPYDEKDQEKIISYDVSIYNGCNELDHTVQIKVFKKITEIKVTNIMSLDIEDKCSYIPIGSKFKLIASNLDKVTKLYTETKAIDLVMLEDSSIIVDLTCFINTNTFLCQTVKSVPKNGTYHFILREDLYNEDYVIKNFSNEKNFSYNSFANEIDMNKTIFEVNVDYQIKPYNSFDIIYEKEVKAVPMIKEHEKGGRFECTFFSETINCPFYESMLPTDPNHPENSKTYIIDIYNLCGSIANSISVKVMRSSYKKLILKGVQLPDEAKCYKGITSMRISFLSDDLSMITTESHTNDILLLNTNEASKSKITMYCTVNSESFICDVSTDIEEDGKYKIFIPEDSHVKPYAIIVPKEFSETIVVSKNFSEINEESFKKEVSFDYKYGSSGSFKIPYKKEVKSVPRIYIPDKNNLILPCEVNSNNAKEIICTFNKEMLEPSTQGIEYIIKIDDFCGRSYEKMSLTVLLTKNRVTINSENYASFQMCNEYKPQKLVDLHFSLEAENPSAKKVNLTEVYYKNKENNEIGISCKNDNNKVFNCNMIDANLQYDGLYTLSLPDQESGEYYLINNYTSENSIYFTSKNYNEPVRKKYEVEIDYSLQDNFDFTLEFKEKLINGIPTVKVIEASKQLQCEANKENLNCLICKGNKDYFPCDEKNEKNKKVYKLEIINVCQQKEKEVDISVTVQKTGKKKDESSKEKKKSKLSTGAKIGIIIGSICVVFVVIGTILYFRVKGNHDLSESSYNDKLKSVGLMFDD